MPEATELETAGLLANVARDDDGSARLIGGRCDRCDARFFPRPAVCAHCLSTEIPEERLSPAGTVHAVTTVHMAPPGFEAPYRLAWVDLDDGVRVFAQLDCDSEPAVGARVITTTKLLRTRSDGTALHGHAFEPERA
jgi:uncharacterized protein